MAFGKTFPKRLFEGFKTTLRYPPNFSKANFHRTLPESGDKGFFRILPEIVSLEMGEKVREKLRGINTVDDNSPSPLTPPNCNGICVKEILKASLEEKLKAKLRDIPHNSISYAHYFRICLQLCHYNQRQGAQLAKIFDHSGNVIVFGDVVFLCPQQVAKTLESLISESIANPEDPRRKELENLERQKAFIDNKARAQVRGELYCGLGFLTVQTLGLMRLTFWELSWDVMEPICFFVTSMYFAFAYIFFLRTSTEPTFQGYFLSRFKAKQQRLMMRYNLDIHRYNQLYKACYPSDYTGEKS